jgi:WD40 repeat protein
MFAHSKIKEYKGHKEQVHTVAWNCDGRRLASGSVDKTARVWIPHRGVSRQKWTNKSTFFFSLSPIYYLGNID